MKFQEVLEGVRRVLPVVTEHIAQTQEIAKAFHFGLGLRILGFSEAIHKFVKQGDPFDILLGSHHKNRLLLKFASWQLREIGRGLFLSGKASSKEKRAERAICRPTRTSKVL